MEEQPDVEILIHIGAPSRAVDDARYRSLAAAYLAFEPAGQVHLCPQDGHYSSTQASRHVLATGEDESTNIPSSDDRISSSFRSPQASFRSVVDNADSPRMRVHEEVHDHRPSPGQQTPASAMQSSWETPPSVVQDSHPMDHADFASLTSPTRVLENYLQHFESSSGSSKPDSQSSRLDVTYGHASQSQRQQRLSPGNLIPCTPQQMIPCTPQATKNIPEPASNKRKRPGRQQGSDNPQQHPDTPTVDISDDNIIEETTFLSSSQPSSALRADSEPPPKLRRLAEVAVSPRALARAASDVGPHKAPGYKAPVTIEFLSSHGFTYESLEIRSPEPPVAGPSVSPRELVTEGLAKLGRDVGLPSRFRPKERTRDLRPYERGYWRLDCSSWDPRLKRDAWAFLANYVGTGIAGWGVWCKRDPDFKEVRAYCWGSVVAHMYYVLWLASQRKIVFTGTCWIDAGGEKVVVMGAREHPREEKYTAS